MEERPGLAHLQKTLRCAGSISVALLQSNCLLIVGLAGVCDLLAVCSRKQ